MKRIISIIICLTFVSQGYSQGKAWTLQQCIDSALVNNAEVMQRSLQMEGQAINWKQSKQNLLPDLNGSISQGINRGRSIDPFTNTYSNEQIGFANYGLNSGLLLFNGFAARNTIKQNEMSYNAAKMDWQQAKENLTINVILAYLAILNDQEILRQSEAQAILTKKQVERLESLNKEGATTPSILNDLQGQYHNDELNILALKNRLVGSKISLAQLMNIPYDQKMMIEPMDPTTMIQMYGSNAQMVFEQAVQNFSLVKAAGFRRMSAEKAVKVAKGRLYPALSFNIGVNTNYSSVATRSIFQSSSFISSSDYVVVGGSNMNVFKQQNNYSTQKLSYGNQLQNNVFSTFSLNLSIPIFNSFQARNNIKLANLTLRSMQVQENATRTGLQQQVEQAFSEMSTAFQRHNVLIEQVKAYEESFRAAEIRFNLGVGNSIDYLTAKNNLDRARLNLISAKYDFVLRSKVLDYYQGK